MLTHALTAHTLASPVLRRVRHKNESGTILINKFDVLLHNNNYYY